MLYLSFFLSHLILSYLTLSHLILSHLILSHQWPRCTRQLFPIPLVTLPLPLPLYLLYLGHSTELLTLMSIIGTCSMSWFAQEIIRSTLKEKTIKTIQTIKNSTNNKKQYIHYENNSLSLHENKFWRENMRSILLSYLFYSSTLFHILKIVFGSHLIPISVRSSWITLTSSLFQTFLFIQCRKKNSSLLILFRIISFFFSFYFSCLLSVRASEVLWT